MSTEPELTYEVPADTPPTRADKLLAAAFPDYSRTRWQKVFTAGKIWREEEALAQKEQLAAGDIVSFEFPEDETPTVEAVDIPLDILYEDEHLIAINKAVGMIVHPGSGTGNDTLVHALLHATGGKLAAAAGALRPGIVHRLDKETSGVIVAAKTDKAYTRLVRAFAKRQLIKEYLAIVKGEPELESGTVEEPIGRHATQRTKMTIREDGRDARSDWRVIRRMQTHSLFRVRIHTGRTHQIRVHMKHIGHPLLGDQTYGWNESIKHPLNPPRVMLHAERLQLEHPETGEELELEAPMPADFALLAH